MRPLLVAVAAGVAITGAAVGNAIGSPAAAGQLVGTVGPGHSITLTAGGKQVTTLKAGTYTLTIHDQAAVHAWALDGPNGYAKDFTTVPFTGTKTFTVVLKKGAYKFYCAPHEASMFGNFSVS